MTGLHVLLTTLLIRTSAKGNAYLARWLGKAPEVALPCEADKFGNLTRHVFLRQPEGRDGPPAHAQSARRAMAGASMHHCRSAPVLAAPIGQRDRERHASAGACLGRGGTGIRRCQ